MTVHQKIKTSVFHNNVMVTEAGFIFQTKHCNTYWSTQPAFYLPEFILDKTSTLITSKYEEAATFNARNKINTKLYC